MGNAQAGGNVQDVVNPPVKVGDTMPSITLDEGFNPIKAVDIAERCKGKKVIILGLPGAFTPC